jgi:hypothetical protein
MPGAYLFAFSKKAFSSERGRPWEEPTFCQLISSPCAYESTMAPSAPRFKERPFVRRMGSSGVSKALASFHKTKEIKAAEKEYISKHQRVSNSTKK